MKNGSHTIIYEKDSRSKALQTVIKPGLMPRKVMLCGGVGKELFTIYLRVAVSQSNV